MFTPLADALFRRHRSQAKKWDAPQPMHQARDRQRHIDHENALRAHIMRHTNMR